MSDQQSSTRRGLRQGVAEDQTAFRVRTEPAARASRRVAATRELRDLVQRRAAALVELEKH